MKNETKEKMAYQNVGCVFPRAWNINPSKGYRYLAKTELERGQTVMTGQVEN